MTTRSELQQELADTRRAVLVWLEGLGAGYTIELTPGEWTLGRSRANEIPLQDPLVGRRHTTLRPDPTASSDLVWLVIDQGSGNGTHVNQEPLRAESRRLQSGDRIQLGEQVFEFRLEDVSDRSTS